MSDPFLPPSASLPTKRSPSPREILWNELESLCVQLQLSPPTETYTLEELQAVVAQRLAQVEQRTA